MDASSSSADADPLNTIAFAALRSHTHASDYAPQLSSNTSTCSLSTAPPRRSPHASSRPSAARSQRLRRLRPRARALRTRQKSARRRATCRRLRTADSSLSSSTNTGAPQSQQCRSRPATSSARHQASLYVALLHANACILDRRMLDHSTHSLTLCLSVLPYDCSTRARRGSRSKSVSRSTSSSPAASNT